MLKLSEFFEEEQSAFVLGAFFSRYIFVNEGKYVLTYGWFKKTAVMETKIVYEDYFDEYVDVINEESMPNSFWKYKNSLPADLEIPRGINKYKTHFYVIENDLHISEDSFYNKLYSKIVTQHWIYVPELNDEKKSFLRGFLELRGSVDTSANYLSQDYYYNSQFEIRKARVIIDLMGIPFNVLNLNFREFQEQFVSGESKRNTQFRPNLWWYMSNIGMVNQYKAEIFAKSRREQPRELDGNVIYFNDNRPAARNRNIFENRLSYYISNVFSRDLSQTDIDRMRADLGFSEGTGGFSRSWALVDLIRNCTADECAGCKNEYRIEDRSYISNRTGRYYFEIHHVISIGINIELDDENNMVKLCPTCHRILKRGSGTREEQLKLIKMIFKNEPKTLEFAKHFFDTDDYELIVQKTFESLN